MKCQSLFPGKNKKSIINLFIVVCCLPNVQTSKCVTVLVLKIEKKNLF